MQRVTLIDNYDSFTFNLVHYLGELGADVSVWRNDEITVADALAEIVLIATGSEVAPTLEAGRVLAEAGTRVRVVSMPCMELFEAQPQEYRDQVLPAAVRARLAVEAGATMSWWKWVGLDGDVLGLDRFGASAPGDTVLKELGFSVENILARAQALLESSH